MQSLYATQTDSINSNVKYINNVQLQHNNLQQTQITANKISELTNKITELSTKVDSSTNILTNELNQAVATGIRSDFGEAICEYIRMFY